MSQGITQPVRDQLERDKARIAELEQSLSAAQERLREAGKEHEDFIEECSALIPESYDGDEAVEAIILNYLRDVNTFAGLITRLTASYR